MWNSVALAPHRESADLTGENRPSRYATPSFFCRLVDDVVYWKVSFLSG